VVRLEAVREDGRLPEWSVPSDIVPMEFALDPGFVLEWQVELSEADVPPDDHRPRQPANYPRVSGTAKQWHVNCAKGSRS